MSEEVLNMPDITCGPLTLDEIKYYFRQKPNKVVSLKNVLQTQERESSPELSSSFEEDLKAEVKYRPFKKSKQEDSSSDEEVFVDGCENEGLFGEPPKVQKETCKINELKIRESLSLAAERDSIFVTKTRPIYTATQELSIYEPSMLENIQVASNLTYVVPTIQVEPAFSKKTPGKRNIKKDKFPHVKSPVAEYIKSSPHSPQFLYVKNNLMANPGSSSRRNFHAAAQVGAKKPKDGDKAAILDGGETAPAQAMKQLPTKSLVKSTTIIESFEVSSSVCIDTYELQREEKNQQDFLEYSLN